jgi:hypothetical protein
MTEVYADADYEPARVHIVRDDTKRDDGGRFTNVVSKTYLAGTSPELILPRSSKRQAATITVMGVSPTAGNVILCDNEADASAAAIYSQTVSGTVPGAAIQPGMTIAVYHNEEVWLARLGTAGTAPLVGVIAEYCK